MFEDTQITRLCLLPKPLAISFLFDVETCIVVDSGATNTSVYVVLEGKVDTDRTRTASVGGWHVSQFLKQALSWKDQKEANSCPTSTSTSSLDASHVKQRCRSVKFNLYYGKEGKTKRTSMPIILFVLVELSNLFNKQTFNIKSENLHNNEVMSQRF